MYREYSYNDMVHLMDPQIIEDTNEVLSNMGINNKEQHVLIRSALAEGKCNTAEELIQRVLRRRG